MQSQNTNLVKTDVTSIACFPHGLLDTELDRRALDLTAEARPVWMLVEYDVVLFGILFILDAILAGVVFLLTGFDTAVGTFLFIAIFSPVIVAYFRPTLGVKIEQSNLQVKELVGDSHGLKFMNANKNGPSFEIPWNSLARVFIADPEERDFNKLTLSFLCTNSKTVNINLLCIHTRENWSTLSRVISMHAPQAELASDIGRALGFSSTDYAYTDIWLESLSCAPESDHLSPLDIAGGLSNGRYKVLGSLSNGGQGHTYSAIDNETGDSVVIKEYMLPTYGSNYVKEQALNVVRAEAQLLQDLSHPHIVKLLDWFVERNRAFLVLNRIKGENLSQHVAATGPLPEAIVLDFAKQICEIMTYLHGRTAPIIHRDITPENLMLDDDRKLTLIDFTIAEPTVRTSSLPPAGKAAYMPPEQYQGESLVESDIYAFGGTLYFLLTGLNPEPLRQLDPIEDGYAVSPPLAGIISRCTAQDSAKRFHSAEEILNSLK